MMGRRGELDTPGHLEVDMGPPSGQVMAGGWPGTRCATDLGTGWTEGCR